jgi:hypothetical protein
VLRGISILEYDISDDAKEVLYSTRSPGISFQIWLAALDGSSAPRLISSTGEESPRFGPGREILFRLTEGNTHYLARMNRDGSGRTKISSYAIGNIEYISPDRRWLTTISPAPETGATTVGGTLAVPTQGGDPRWICRGCGVTALWALDGRFLYIQLQRESHGGPAKTVGIPIPRGETLPRLPAAGIRGLDLENVFPAARVIDAYRIAPSADPSVYAYVKTTTHRNLFRIPLPSD